MSYAHPQCMSYLVKRSKERTEELRQAAKRKPTLSEWRAWRIMFLSTCLDVKNKDQGFL